ncbi:hypothetical protein L6R52_13090 [Myxococcota bacterium]|nr:hypothetical protein [Myxococcota bacterium]
MKKGLVKALHIYEKDPRKFESDLNEALERLIGRGAIVDEILYAIDPSTEANRRGGFGALVVYELESELDPATA